MIARKYYVSRFLSFPNRYLESEYDPRCAINDPDNELKTSTHSLQV
jgi:hypothetical protein